MENFTLEFEDKNIDVPFRATSCKVSDLLEHERSLLMDKLELINNKYKEPTEKLIKGHKEKLQEYKNDPLKNDNKKILEGKTKEIQEKIIDGRVKKLEKEIQKFESNIEKNKDLIKNIQDKLNKIKI